jgi:hypothetical protein
MATMPCWLGSMLCWPDVMRSGWVRCFVVQKRRFLGCAGEIGAVDEVEAWFVGQKSLQA